MALHYNINYNNIAKIGKKVIKFKPWNTKNEKDYLIAVESEDKITDSMLYDTLIKPCLEDPSIVLSQNEQNMLMIEIRKKSLGSTFPLRFTCNACKKLNDSEIDFDDIVKFKPDDWKDVKIDNLIFEFGPIPSSKLKSKLDETNINIERSFIDFLIHIRSITIENVKEDTFTYDELKSFIEDLPTMVFDKAFAEFRSMKSSLTFEHSINCLFCGESNKIDFNYLPNFLWT